MLTETLGNFQSLGHEPKYFKGNFLTADSIYRTQINLPQCLELGLDAYITDRKFRNRDPRFAIIGFTDENLTFISSYPLESANMIRGLPMNILY